MYQCSSCRTQFSVTSGTVFHHSHIPLRDWFLAVYFMAVSKDRLPATQLERILGVTYETAFSVKKRLVGARVLSRWVAARTSPKVFRDNHGEAPAATPDF